MTAVSRLKEIKNSTVNYAKENPDQIIALLIGIISAAPIGTIAKKVIDQIND